MAEWGESVHVEMSQEKFRDLQLAKNEAVFIVPRENEIFQGGRERRVFDPESDPCSRGPRNRGAGSKTRPYKASSVVGE